MPTIKRVGILPFGLGATVAEQVSAECVQLYFFVAESILGEECELLGQQDGLYTIPISNSQIHSQPYTVYSEFMEHYTSWKKLPDLVIVDMATSTEGIVRASLLLHLAQAITNTLTCGTPSQGSTPEFVILTPQLPPPSDAVRKALDTLIAVDRLRVIGNDGRCLPIGTWLKEPDDYRIRMTEARGDVLSQLRRKMVCRLGHFERQLASGEDCCVRYYYDGSLCDRELTKLLGQYLEENRLASKRTVLLYDSPISPWLEPAVLALALDRALIAIDIQTRDGQFIKDSLLKDGKLVLIVGMIDSGQSVASIISMLAEHSLPVPSIVSVLATKVADKRKGVRELVVQGQVLRANYLMRAEQRLYPRRKCPMCELGIPRLNRPPDVEHYMLSSYDHWEMGRGSGLKVESDVPDYRGPLGDVLDYPGMIATHRAWLASKIKQRLEFEGMPSDALVVCPKERGSLALANCLSSVLGASVIMIPREVIYTSIEGSEALIHEQALWEQAHPEWYRLLSSATDAEVIIMDEFNASGHTFIGLRNLLLHFGKSPMCYFPLNDLNPSWSRTCSVPVYTLYDWQVYG